MSKEKKPVVKKTTVPKAKKIPSGKYAIVTDEKTKKLVMIRSTRIGNQKTKFQGEMNDCKTYIRKAEKK